MTTLLLMLKIVKMQNILLIFIFQNLQGYLEFILLLYYFKHHIFFPQMLSKALAGFILLIVILLLGQWLLSSLVFMFLFMCMVYLCMFELLYLGQGCQDRDPT